VCSPWFRAPGPLECSALPFPGSSEASSPASTVLWRCPTPCAPLAALRCLRLAIPCGVPVVSLPAVQNTKPRAWGSFSGPHFRTWPQGGNQGLPGSRTTHCPFALFSDPGRTEHARPSRRVGMAPAMTTTKAPTNNPAFEAQSHGFRTRCLRFVPCVAARDAKLASGRWPSATGRDCLPAGLLRKVSDVTHPPLPSFPGARSFRVLFG
jgi:hypothetical protein